MSVKNNNEKTNLKLYDLPLDVTQSEVESFLSKYKGEINSIALQDIKNYKEMKKIARVSFKNNKSANECRLEMNLKKLKKSSVRIVWDEKDFQLKNYNQNNLYIKNIPKEKTSRELFEYFNKFGDIFSIKINEDEEGNNVGTGYITYYSLDDTKKAISETNGKKIWNSNMELLYQSQYKNNFHSNDNLKININNLPDTYDKEDLKKLCEEFGKVQSYNIFNGQYGKYAIVGFSNEQEAKQAKEKLNNKEINGKKIVVKEFQRKPKPNYQQNNNNFYYNKPYEPYENTNLYIRNIPLSVTEDDIRKNFEQFGTIKSIRLEKETFQKTENGETKKITTNKGFGYIAFETAQSAKTAMESMNAKYLKGFEAWPRPLLIDFFISKQKREMMDNIAQQRINMYGFPNGMMFQPLPGFPPQYPPMMPMTFQGQFPMPPNTLWYPGNNKRGGYNAGYKQKYNNKRGGHRGGYYKNNYQRKYNNNENNVNQTENKEEEISFNYEAFNKLSNDDEKKDFLGEMLFNAIQKNPYIIEKKIDIDVVGKITGMIIEIPFEEIIDILKRPSALNSRIQEALSLLNINDK